MGVQLVWLEFKKGKREGLMGNGSYPAMSE